LLKEISDAIALVDTEALGEFGVVAAYLVTGKEIALVDMGYRSSASVVLRDLEARGLQDLDYLLPTHVHLDHCGACGTIARKFPDASILSHPIGVPHLIDPGRLVKAAGQLFGDELMRRYGVPEPIDPKRVKNVADEETINLGKGVTLRSIWTPGHASHHLSYLLEGSADFITGDAVSLRYPSYPAPIPTTPPTSFNLEKTLASIGRIRSFSPTRLFAPHFGVVAGAGKWLDDNVEVLVHWKETLADLIMMNRSVEQIVGIMTERVSAQAKISSSEIPSFLKTSIRVSVLGFLRYLTGKTS